jgi:uncharacterized protein YxeA
MKKYIIKMLTLVVFASVALTSCSLQYQQRKHQYDRNGRDGYQRDRNQRNQQDRYQHDQRGQTQKGNYHDDRSSFHN